MRRTVAELVDEDEPGWPLVQEWIDEAVVPVEVLPESHAAIELTLPGGARLTIPDGVSAATLQTVLTAVRTAC